MSRRLKYEEISLSTQTIKNRLKEKGFAYRFPVYKPVLTQKQKQIDQDFLKKTKPEIGTNLFLQMKLLLY